MTRSFGAIAVAAGLVLLAGSARAEEVSPEAARRAAARDEAKAWFIKARADFDAGRHKQALEALRRAHELQRLPLLLRYMGDCYHALGEHELAVSHYRRYLSRTTEEAPDRDYVQKRLAQSEKLARETREKEYAGRKVPTRLMPTGKDRENPLPTRSAPTPAGRDDRSRSWLRVGKWSSLALAVGGLAMGITFNRLAASKADELRGAIQSACPPGAPSCPGNPGLDRPVVSYSLEHYELQRQMKRNNAIAVTSFVVGGVAAASSAVMFWLDHRRVRAARSRVSVAPTLGAGQLGLGGEVSF